MPISPGLRWLREAVESGPVTIEYPHEKFVVEVRRYDPSQDDDRFLADGGEKHE